MKNLLILALVSSAALAHDMYIMPSSFFPAAGSPLTVGFHIGDAFPESEVNTRVARLQNPRLIGKGGEVPVTRLRIAGKRNLGDAALKAPGEWIAVVSTPPNLITLQPDKFRQYLKAEGLTDVIAWREKNGESAKPGKERYSKYSKSILLSGASDGFFNHVAGYIVEIVPEADPYALKAGDLLPVRVLFRGQPAADVQIEAAWAGAGGSKRTVAGRTDAEGRLKVPIPTAGRWRLHTIKMERCADAKVADWESFWASLTFEVR